MIRNLVIILCVIGGFVFLASFGNGMGYAQGGGDVRILSSWTEAHSQTGQAVAIYGDDAHVVADNTPHSSSATRGNDTADQLLIAVLMVGLVGVGAFFGYISQLSEEPAPSTNYIHYSAKEAEEWERSYGPD